MITNQHEAMIQGDFEKYMHHLREEKHNFDFEAFGAFATSLLNFYIGSSSITLSEKHDASLYLIKLYNLGIGNIIDQEDIQILSKLITEDATLDYSVLKPIFH